MEPITKLQRIEMNSDTSIGILLKKQIINGETLMSEGNHRALITQGDNVDERLSGVSKHLVAMGFPPIVDGDIKKIKDFVNLAWG